MKSWDLLIYFPAMIMIHVHVIHPYIAKLGYAGVYLVFLFLLKNIDCGYSLEPPRQGGSNKHRLRVLVRGGSNMCPQSMF